MKDIIKKILQEDKKKLFIPRKTELEKMVKDGSD